MSSPTPEQQFESKGFAVFGFDPSIVAWARHAFALAPGILSDPVHAHWWRHANTWFVGVDSLPNNDSGQLPGGPPLAGEVINFIRTRLNFDGPWHKGQLSVCYPGYPLQDATETEAQHNYRVNRDAAHVDGLHGEGPLKRRHFREQHQFILGLPLNACDKAAAPFVVWEGSHHIMQDAFNAAFKDKDPACWADIDVTDIYQAARRQAFTQCKRTVLHAAPGEAFVVHRLALHGVAPWTAPEAADSLRAIAYFRPPFPHMYQLQQ